MPVVGIDVGGTRVKAGLIAAGGEVLAEERVPTPPDAGALLEATAGLVARLSRRAGAPPSAIGVGLAAVVHRPTGEVRWSVNTAWGAGRPADGLSRRTGLPVIVDNDANAAGLAELRLGAARGARTAVLLTLGTGVGGAIVLDGRIERGGDGLGAELGHVVVRSDGPACPGPGCPGRGCLEAYVGARALTAAAREAARAAPGGGIAAALAGGETPGPELLGRLGRAGDPGALAILEAAGRELGAGIASLANIFAPEVVVVAGGVAGLGELLLSPARREYRRRALPPLAGARVALAALGERAGMIGAGLMAMEER